MAETPTDERPAKRAKIEENDREEEEEEQEEDAMMDEPVRASDLYLDTVRFHPYEMAPSDPLLDQPRCLGF